jgi:hypothetical protein
VSSFPVGSNPCLFLDHLQVLAEWAYTSAVSLVILMSVYIMFKRYLVQVANHILI